MQVVPIDFQHLGGQYHDFALIFVRAAHCLFGSFPNIAPNDQYEDKKPVHIDDRRMKNILKKILKNLFVCKIQKTRKLPFDRMSGV